MAEKSDDLLAQLAQGSLTDDREPWDALAATEPAHARTSDRSEEDDPKLRELVSRIHALTRETSSPSTTETATAAVTAIVASSTEPADADDGPEVNGFFPTEPESFAQAGLTDSEVEALVLKFLLARGEAVGRDIADQVKLPFVLVSELLRQMKNDQLVVYRSSTALNDYSYQLTDLGQERARRLSDHCTYFGAAPVPLADYIESVRLQSLEHQRPSVDDLRGALSDLYIAPEMLRRLGPAIHSGRGLFLYGAPGNGKTSIAERVTRAFGPYVWIPRAIGVDGEIIRLFDPVNHEEAPWVRHQGLLDHSKVDRRWVRVRRPTIVVGGELTMSSLEVTLNTSTGICEAPLQLKSNCGTLVIDDFGRQRMSIDELLNRWIVPLEKRFDYLNLPNGKKVQVPFNQLIIFSTNLEPRDLVDDAFLRRIPYKIEVTDPTEDEFRKLFEMMCPILGFEYDSEAIEYLIETHYRKVGRPFRCCQPRDLLLQVRNYCTFENEPMRLTPRMFDFAVENYFSVM